MGLLRLALLCSLVLPWSLAWGQGLPFELPVSRGNLRVVSVDEFLKPTESVSSRKAESTRETPSVVTVISREEIIRSGARDLLDVLLLVPGFSFGVDVWNVVGVGVRGNWGHEGKVLLLVDGQEMNETLYSTTQWGNRFPIDQIQRVEIIRGPGSVVYGGYAELAVINVITNHRDPSGALQGSLVISDLGDSIGRRNVSLSYQQGFANDLHVSLSGFYGDGDRSDKKYLDLSGTEDGQFSLAGNADVNPMQGNVGLDYKDLHLRFMAENYRNSTRDAFDAALPQAARFRFITYIADAQVQLKINDKLTLTPRLNYKHQKPWQVLSKNDIYYDKTAERYLASLSVDYTPIESVNLIGGLEGFIDYARLNDLEIVGIQTLFGDKESVRYFNLASFAQVLYKSALANVTAGVRAEYHEEFGRSLVPRLALTKAFGSIHGKLLFSQAFRAPGIENINAGDGKIKPETTTVLEAEAGYEISEHMQLNLNVFDITIRDAIVYGYDGGDVYSNEGATGTRGAELDFRLRHERGYVVFGYSYYSAAGKNHVQPYVTSSESRLLGFPGHKVTFSENFSFLNHFGISPSAVFLSSRIGYLSADENGVAKMSSTESTLLLNLFLYYQSEKDHGLNVGAGIYNILDEDFAFIQPYAAGHAPLPGLGRELLVRLSYTLPVE
ncbi:MAG: TonB-dependent receptor [Deltaproteobacteria bacterium]|nr:TonB-dependent receptor [Deltaproteobacteria bacterium]